MATNLNLSLCRHPTKKVDFLVGARWYDRSKSGSMCRFAVVYQGEAWGYDPVYHSWLPAHNWLAYTDDDAMFKCLSSPWPRCDPPPDVRNEPWNI